MPGGVPDLSPRFNLDWSAAKNWVDRNKVNMGELPPYIASVATALMEDQGMDRSRAIATGVTSVAWWCEHGTARNLKGNPKVSPAVRAAACEQIAMWKAMVAEA